MNSMTRLSPVTNIGQVKLPLLVHKSMHLWITGMIQQYQAFKKVPFSHPGRDFFPASPARQATFHFHLPTEQGVRQALRQLNQ